MIELATVLSTSEPASVIAVSLCIIVVAFTGLSIYTAFGPPSRELTDPFDEHED
ncbi:MAG: photosystem II reaction center protein PsbN [Cyanothece sp. SIO1E1]|nr:photosystem II reaction center protein PsbN [Cyanothece sp. SIO1E1]